MSHLTYERLRLIFIRNITKEVKLMYGLQVKNSKNNDNKFGGIEIKFTFKIRFPSNILFSNQTNPNR